MSTNFDDDLCKLLFDEDYLPYEFPDNEDRDEDPDYVVTEIKENYEIAGEKLV